VALKKPGVSTSEEAKRRTTEEAGDSKGGRSNRSPRREGRPNTKYFGPDWLHVKRTQPAERERERETCIDRKGGEQQWVREREEGAGQPRPVVAAVFVLS
jgi:hypothetical protein